MQQTARHFHRAIKALYKDIENPPWKLQIREGQGIHVLFFSAPDHPLQTTITPNDIGLGGQWESHYTSMYVAGNPELTEDESSWVERLHAALKVLDEDPEWQELVQWAMTRPGISVKSRKENVAGRETSGEELLVRIIEQCNAACDFCGCIGISSDYATREDSIRQRLQEGFNQGIRRVAFTGGEPTLVKTLPDYVRWAKEIGFEWVNIQTNGVRLANAALTHQLAEAGADSLLLSLHSHIPEIHDQILKLDGGFHQAIQGIRNSLESGINVGLNYVINRDNLNELPGYMEFVCDLWRSIENNRANRGVTVTLSFVSPVGWTLEHLDLIPKLTDAAPKIAQALETAENWGVEAHIPGLCGVPICILPGYEKFFDEYHNINPARISTREHVAACDSCDYNDRCSGYWTEYFNIYGKDELGYREKTEFFREEQRFQPSDELKEMVARAFAALGITGSSHHAQIPLLEIATFFEEENIPCPLPGRWSEKRCQQLMEALGIPRRFTDVSPPPKWLTSMARQMKHLGEHDSSELGANTHDGERRNGRLLDIRFQRQTVEILLGTGPDSQMTIVDPKPRFKYTVEGTRATVQALLEQLEGIQQLNGQEHNDQSEVPIETDAGRSKMTCAVSSRKGRRAISRWVRSDEGNRILNHDESGLGHYLAEKGITDFLSPIAYESNEDGQLVLMNQRETWDIGHAFESLYFTLDIHFADANPEVIVWSEGSEMRFQLTKEKENIFEQLFKKLSEAERGFTFVRMHGGSEADFNRALFNYFTHGNENNAGVPHWSTWFSGRVVVDAMNWSSMAEFFQECRKRMAPPHQVARHGLSRTH